MKIEIFKLLIENINKLNPLDFIIIFVLFALVIFNCYYFLRWIYRDVYETQQKSLHIKNGIISDLEKKSTLIEQHRQIIEDRMNSFSSYALFLESQLEKVHHEKNKTEEERDLLKRNASKLLYTIVLLFFATGILEVFENWRGIITEAAKLADEGKVPKNEKALHYLVRIADIEKRVIEAMSTVNCLVVPTPKEAFERLSVSKLPVPELVEFDLKSVMEELKKMSEEMQKSYLEILHANVNSSQS